MSTESKCPFPHGARNAGARSNSDWWPNQLNLQPLQQNPPTRDPMGDDFDYAAEFKTLDLEALKKGFANLVRHIGNLKKFGVPVVARRARLFFTICRWIFFLRRSFRSWVVFCASRRPRNSSRPSRSSRTRSPVRYALAPVCSLDESGTNRSAVSTGRA